jgi:thioredoxin-like negative regulator of GroEL
MAPAFERAAAELEPDYRLLKVNTEEEQSLAARYGIRSIPTLIYPISSPIDRLLYDRPRGGATSCR